MAIGAIAAAATLVKGTTAAMIKEAATGSVKEAALSTAKKLAPEIKNGNPAALELKNGLAEDSIGIWENLKGLIESWSVEDGYININIKTINQHLEGNIHPISGVPYIRKTITIGRVRITGVFPDFSSFSLYESNIPSELHKGSHAQQTQYCNSELKEAIADNSELKKQFNGEQLEQIQNGDTPSGLTWHHNEELGKMQLVDSKIHNQTPHTGGMKIWGRGHN